MRFFIALEIPETNLDELIKVQQQVKQILPEIRLTVPQKLHLTIAFIGEQPESLKEDLIRLITVAADGVSPFTVSAGIIDGFPTLHHPKVLWMGVNGELDKLLIIRERIKDGLNNLSLPIDERRYIPHIALAKATDLQLNTHEEEALHKIALQAFSPIRVSSIKLFESIASGSLHTHNTLAEIRLHE